MLKQDSEDTVGGSAYSSVAELVLGRVVRPGIESRPKTTSKVFSSIQA